ncbi:MAG TPA: AAA family ATPase, partial [Roseiflexaceae bacterium]|nr:AAA family ATPase [Roseiflexaceae bacterium]
MRIHLLGSCQVLRHDQPLVVRRRRVRALLYRLAAQPDPVPRSILAFLFWPDEPDVVARRQLTRLLSSLRAELPDPQCLLVDEDMVMLDPARVQVDTRQFLGYAAQTETTALMAAAALYHGPFMAGFSLAEAPEYEAWQADTAQQMQETYLALLEQLTERMAAAGDPAAAIRYAQQSLAIDELAEPMHRRLIALYIAAGDRVAAQRQLDTCSLILERELGVGPLPETRAALQVQVALPRPIMPVWPSLDLPLIGRDDALAQLQAAYHELAGRHGQYGGVILLYGEQGIGKSRLLREFIARQSGVICAGACHADGHGMPYYPLIAALRPTLANERLWRLVAAHWRSELMRLLPDLRQIFPDLPAPPLGSESPLAQQQLYTALTQALCAFAGRHATLLCLDDLHLADAATIGWLRSLADGQHDRPLVVVATLTGPTPAIDSLRALLVRSGRLAEISLDRLTLVATRQVLAQLPRQLAPDLAQRIHQITAGNPLFLLEMIRELQQRSQLAHPPADLPLPSTVRDLMLTRIRSLGPMARQVLEAVAVLDPHLTTAVLYRTAARTTAETIDALDELVAQQLLQIGSEARTAVPAFSHALLRMTVLHTLSPWRRILLHRRAAEALAQLQPTHYAARAHHAAAAEMWDAAITAFCRAAEQACDMYAFAVALTHLDAAWSLVPYATQPEATRLGLLRRRLALHRMLVQLPEWQADTAELLQLADRLGDTAARLDALEAQMSLHVLLSDFALIEATATPALALALQL